MKKHPEADRSTLRVTMKDIALTAGVSQSTVSFVLNGADDMRIADETRQRVIDAANQLGYQRRGVGRPGRQEIRQIGFMVDEIATSPFAAISIEAAQEAAWREGVLLQIAMTGESQEYERKVLQQWSQQGVAGVIYASILTRQVKPPDALAGHRVALLNCYDPEQQFNSIVPAERRGGYTATRTLLDAGYQRIAFIGGEPWMDASRQRQEGYESALIEAGLPINQALICEGNFLASGGYQHTQRLITSGQPPEAIFCGNDLTAIGCYGALKENGIRIPEDMAVVGYDDQEIAQHLSPKLTTVLLPHREMGQWCVSYILGEDTGSTPQQQRIECPLVRRDSA